MMSAPEARAISSSRSSWTSTSAAIRNSPAYSRNSRSLRVGKNGRDEQDGIGAVRRRFGDLDFVEDEVLAQHRQRGRRARRAQVGQAALEELLVGEHGERRGAALFIIPGDGRRVEIVDQQALARGSFLDLGDDGGVVRAQRGAEIPPAGQDFSSARRSHSARVTEARASSARLCSTIRARMPGSASIIQGIPHRSKVGGVIIGSYESCRPPLRSLVALLTVASAIVCAQGREYVESHYTKHEYRIPMRDGKKLFTAVYAPKDEAQTYPILLVRTPYGVAPYGAAKYPDSLGPSAIFTTSGYIVVYQDVRGTHESEGRFRGCAAVYSA